MTRLGSPERRLPRKHQAFFVPNHRPTDRFHYGAEPYRKPTLTKNRAYACFPRPDGREHEAGGVFFVSRFHYLFSPGDGLSKFSKAINILKICPFRSYFESNLPQAGHATRRHPLRPTVARVWQEPTRFHRPRTFAFRAFVPKRATRQRAGLNDEEQTVRLSPHTLTERNAEAESKKYFVLLLSF